MSHVKYEGYDRDFAKQSVGKGWASLIDEVFDMLETMEHPPKIIQVKEKWGGLRIYDSGVYSTIIPTNFEKLLREIERKSYTICENCGEQGVLRRGNWMKTLCDVHAEGREPIETINGKFLLYDN
jgi:hypothetical protein